MSTYPFVVLALLAKFIAASALLALFACVARAMLTRRIRFEGLLSDKFDNQLSGGRLQALLATGAVILAYAGLAIRQLASGDVTKIPDAQAWMIATLGGSQLGYLVAKGVSAKNTLTMQGDKTTKGGTQ
jgi:hypothetical protein